MTPSCFVCGQMRSRRPQVHGDRAPANVDKTCLLCNRPFCKTHKGKEPGVCEINHFTYYYKHPDLPNVYASLAEREAAQNKVGTGSFLRCVL